MLIFFAIIVTWLLFRGAGASRRTNRLLAYHPAIAIGIRRERRYKIIGGCMVVVYTAVVLYSHKDETKAAPLTAPAIEQQAPVAQPSSPKRTDGHHRFNRNDWRYNSPEDFN